MDDQTREPTVNEPEVRLPMAPLTLSEVRKGITLDELEEDVRLRTIAREFHEGFEFIERRRQSVTFFGSTRFKPDNPHYQETYNLAKRLSQELGYAITTGGGPGIMEAANRGAFEAGGESYGICIQLPMGQLKNPYLTDSIKLRYFFTRKVLLAFAASAYVFCPGGFGTLDELFEILVLVQTYKIEPVPIILFGSGGYWESLQQFIETELKDHSKTIDATDTNLYTITSSPDEVLEIIKQAPHRQ